MASCEIGCPIQSKTYLSCVCQDRLHATAVTTDGFSESDGTCLCRPLIGTTGVFGHSPTTGGVVEQEGRGGMIVLGTLRITIQGRVGQRTCRVFNLVLALHLTRTWIADNVGLAR